MNQSIHTQDSWTVNIHGIDFKFSSDHDSENLATYFSVQCGTLVFLMQMTSLAGTFTIKDREQIPEKILDIESLLSDCIQQHRISFLSEKNIASKNHK